ncbi:ABC transporter substrate-binding protein [Methylobacterium nonmethylotrophicum]|uniref:Amino acid ABC transporter substrate-binding protein n=1 Tax=Methylobacterium nonmethylotrophicum TaxID=1141884 RepID=A0A4Z0NR31_9HYPH|nr:ABC transporter substrate-binding protein [Methylobacterium nonmethylotrophicum]TGD99503.1 amino acid ABC transporter substrate-binding protein [Methylobacterium nonmethylotrophicum]
MHRRDVLLGGAAALAALAQARPARAAEEVLIGAVYPMSGANAQVGVDGRHALETAIEIVNGVHDLDLPGARAAGLSGLGGARIRLVMADHQADPQKGRGEAERLITQSKVAGIVGTYHSSVAATVSVTCERYGVPFVAADSSSPSLHKRNLRYFFRPAAHDEMFSAAIFDLLDAERKKGARVESVALFYEDTIFGVDSSTVQRKLATERGYRIAADVKYRSNSPSLTAEVQQLKSADADVVLPSSYTTDAILLVKTMAELGYRPRAMIAQAAGFAEKATFESVGDKLDGLVSRASFALDLAAKRPSIGVVNEMYRARAGRDLNDNTARLVEAMLVLADAINRARSLDGAKIREALAATNTPAGQTIMPWRGIAFGADGQNTLCDPVLIQYRDGRFVTVFPDAFAAAALKWPMNG